MVLRIGANGKANGNLDLIQGSGFLAKIKARGLSVGGRGILGSRIS